MSDRAEIIETMARALFYGFRLEVEDPPLVTWEDHEVDPCHEDYIAAASAALTALEASGMAVVPVEPTEAMLDNGGSSITRPSIYMGGTPPGAKRRARDVWAAMLATHTQEKDE